MEVRKRGRRKNFEILFYEQLLEKKPDFVQALSCLGDAYTRRGFIKEGLEVDKRLAVLKPEDPIVHYNLACSFSLMGDLDQAFRELTKAVLLGYEDVAYILEDPDLEQLRKTAVFEKFFRKLKKIDNGS